MSLILFLSYIVVAVIWLFMLLLAIIIYLCNKNDESNKVYENCTEKTATHQYIVRLVYGITKDDIDHKHTTITMDIRDSSKRLLSKIAFTPKIMRNSHKDPKLIDKKVARFRLYRNKPLKDIGYVDLNHNSPYGSLFVAAITIQEANSDSANQSFVNDKIENLERHKVERKQQYEAGTIMRNFKDDRPPTQTLTCVEFIAFLFISVNIILLSCVLIIPCISKQLCRDYRDGLASSAFAGLVASLLAILCFVFTIVIYRYAIKRKYAKGVKGCASIRLVYIFAIIFVGMICGAVAAFLASNSNKFNVKQKNSQSNPQPLDHEIYWVLACGIGIIVFLLLWIPVFAVIAYFCGFFGSVSIKPSSKVEEQTVPKKSLGSGNVTSRSNTISDSDEHKPSKRATKSKSRINQKSSASIPKKIKTYEKKAKSAKTKPMERTPSIESTGENYYQTIVQRHGKVKSVSQYPGLGS